MILLTFFFLLCVGKRVAARTTILTFSDDSCGGSAYQTIGGPDTGECQMGTIGNYSSFQIGSIDDTCVVTGYASDNEYCSSDNKWALQFNYCYTNASISQFSVDCAESVEASASAAAAAGSTSSTAAPSTSSRASSSAISTFQTVTSASSSITATSTAGATTTADKSPSSTTDTPGSSAGSTTSSGGGDLSSGGAVGVSIGSLVVAVIGAFLAWQHNKKSRHQAQQVIDLANRKEERRKRDRDLEQGEELRDMSRNRGLDGGRR